MSDVAEEATRISACFGLPVLTQVMGMPEVYKLNAKGWRVESLACHRPDQGPPHNIHYYTHMIAFCPYGPLKAGEIPGRVLHLRHPDFPDLTLTHLREGSDDETYDIVPMRKLFLADLQQVQAQNEPNIPACSGMTP